MGNFLLSIGASVITKLGQLRFIINWNKRITNWGSIILLQIGAAFFITNWGSLIITNQVSYYELGQPLLQIGAAITNSGNYYKLGHNSTSERVNFLKRRLANIQSFLQKLEPEEQKSIILEQHFSEQSLLKTFLWLHL